MNRSRNGEAKYEIRGGGRRLGALGSWGTPRCALLLAAVLTLAGCGSGSSESASQMSSYSSSGEEAAGLFTLNPDQLAHVQVLTVAPSSGRYFFHGHSWSARSLIPT